jgi:hypothetical protein
VLQPLSAPALDWPAYATTCAVSRVEREIEGSGSLLVGAGGGWGVTPCTRDYIPRCFVRVPPFPPSPKVPVVLAYVLVGI